MKRTKLFLTLQQRLLVKSGGLWFKKKKAHPVLETLWKRSETFETTRKSRGVDASSIISTVVQEQSKHKSPAVWHLPFSECQLSGALQVKGVLILLFSKMPSMLNATAPHGILIYSRCGLSGSQNAEYPSQASWQDSNLCIHIHGEQCIKAVLN